MTAAADPYGLAPLHEFQRTGMLRYVTPTEYVDQISKEPKAVLPNVVPHADQRLKPSLNTGGPPPTGQPPEAVPMSIQLGADAAGHEHKGKGKAEGQFVSKTRIAGADWNGKLIHGTTEKSAKHYIAGTDLPESDRSKTMSEWGNDVIYTSDHDAPHQALMFASHRSKGAGGKRLMLEFQLKPGSKVIDLSDEITRRPAWGMGGPEMIEFKDGAKPSFTEDMVTWLSDKRAAAGHTRKIDVRAYTDPEAEGFVPSEYLNLLKTYAKDRGFAAVRFHDETVIVNRSAIQSSRKMSNDEVEELRQKPRLRRPYKGGSLYSDFEDNSPSENHAEDRRNDSVPFGRNASAIHYDTSRRKGPGDPSHAGAFAPAGQGVQFPGAVKPQVPVPSVAKGPQPPQLSKPAAPVSSAVSPDAATLKKPRQQEQEPQPIKPGQLAQHLAAGADPAELLHGGQFPWHIATSGDVHAMQGYLGSMPSSQFWGLAQQVAGGLHAARNDDHVDAARNLLKRAAMNRAAGPWVKLNNQNRGNAFVLDAENPTMLIHALDALKGLPQVAGIANGLYGVYLPAGFDVGKFLGPDYKDVKARPIDSPEWRGEGKPVSQLPSLVPLPSDVELPQANFTSASASPVARGWRQASPQEPSSVNPQIDAPYVAPVRMRNRRTQPRNEAWPHHTPEQAQERQDVGTLLGSEDNVIGLRPLQEGGANGSHRADFTKGHSGILKPEREEKSGFRHGVPNQTMHKREVAASHVAEVAGFADLVPKTVRHYSGSKGVGSMQHFVKGSTVAHKVGDVDRFDGSEDLARAATFDYLIGHMDRHWGNWMVSGDKGKEKLHLIDNGLSFPVQDQHPRDYRDAELMRQAHDDDLALPDLSHMEGKWPAIKKAMEDAKLEPEAIQLAQERYSNLMDAHATAKATGTPFRFADLPGLAGMKTMGHTRNYMVERR